MNELISNMDWELLRRQKQWLLTRTIEEDSEMANGLLHLIDNLQDAALAEGVDELDIFGSLTV